jgi:hypothetical protein
MNTLLHCRRLQLLLTVPILLLSLLALVIVNIVALSAQLHAILSTINVWYVSVAHPRVNGQVERANGMVLDALKKRLHDAANTKGGKWIKELPNALLGLRIQPTKPTGQSPYFLVYGSEAILPADIM